MFDTGTEQSPQGNELELKDGISKATYRVWSDHPNFESLHLVAKLGPFEIKKNTLIPRVAHHTVVFNSCTDSSEAELKCTEVQISLWGMIHPFKEISYFLHNKTDAYQLLSTINLVQHHDTGTRYC